LQTIQAVTAGNNELIMAGETPIVVQRAPHSSRLSISRSHGSAFDPE
jgi:hypothetical protein